MNDLNTISEIFDSVVMLTTSNWKTELRSNRYHYASRFAKLLPVIFVQPDLSSETYSFETTEIDNLWILHVFQNYAEQSQISLMAKALNEKGIIAPLLWLYNPLFTEYFQKAYAPYKIYHATEDLYSPDFPGSPLPKTLLDSLDKVINTADEVICVSEGVMNNIIGRNLKWQNKLRTITNGCDYEFYAIDASYQAKNNKKIAIYQGNIFDKIDFKLLSEVVKNMPEWTFQFCGPVILSPDNWKRFLSEHNNVEYLGVLNPNQLKLAMQEATVGIIPFGQAAYLVNSSFPLKAFEYIACGLPVVSTTIEALKAFDDSFLFADDAQSFITQLSLAEARRNDPEFIKKTQLIAKKQSYDVKFARVLEGIQTKITLKNNAVKEKLHILILYEPKSTKITTIKEYLESFGLFSNHTITYGTATPDADVVNDLSPFDAVVIHYSLRLSVSSGDWTLSNKVKHLLQHYAGFKAAIVQDEYESTDIAIDWFQKLGIHLVFTCVPEQYQRIVYPKDKLPFTQFIQILTGYISPALEHYLCKKTTDRKTSIAYRGRSLPYWYGTLGQEKEYIGIKMKECCLKNNIPQDIEHDDAKRIYGDDWYTFLASSKATLGTESGANIFDYSGEISRQVKSYLEEHPSANYQEVFELFLQEHEGIVKMNQISPKIFEAISLHTALILFEGEYSGVVEADKHYIPLKKDFSNIDEVLAKVRDDAYLSQLTKTAYADIVLSQKYSYQSFINFFDATMSSFVPRAKEIQDVIREKGLVEDNTCYKLLIPSISPKKTLKKTLNRVKNRMPPSAKRIIRVIVPKAIRQKLV